MDKKELKEKIEQGHLLTRAIIEVVGRPKEHVEKAISDLIEHIKQDKEIIVLAEHKEEAKEQEKELWGTFVELELLAKNFQKLMGFCFDYMPSSIEIIEPEDFKFKSREVAGFLNDLQEKLHGLGVMIKNLKNENIFLRQNTANILMNFIMVLAASGKRTMENLSKLTGIESDELKPFVEKLLKDGKIKKEGETYTFAK
jgi:hypothetical protein